MREYPQYDPNDVRNWLTKVFGDDIIFDTQAAADFRERTEDKNNVLGGWHLYYTGELFLQVDLPPGQNQLLADTLRSHLERAMHAALVPEYWSKPIGVRKNAVRESGWPLPEDVISGGLRFDTALLKDLAERLETPADYIRSFANEVKSVEAEWIERKEKLERRCALAFIGREPGDDAHWQFRYRDIRNWGGKMELAFMLPTIWPPVFPENDIEGNDWVKTRGWEDQWAKRSRDLGLDAAFRYSNFSIGTQAPIDEQKLVLHGNSDMDIANKMDALLDPETLPKVQMYFNEVLAATLTKLWLNDYHPDFASELQKAWDGVTAKGKAAVSERNKIRITLEKNETYRQWKETVPKLIEAYPTTGALIKAVHGPAPEGSEEIYETLRGWSKNTFPLLTKAITGGAVAPKIQPAAGPHFSA